MELDRNPVSDAVDDDIIYISLPNREYTDQIYMA